MPQDLKNQNIKQKQQSNKLNKDFQKMVGMEKKKNFFNVQNSPFSENLYKVLIKVVNKVENHLPTLRVRKDNRNTEHWGDLFSAVIFFTLLLANQFLF